MARLPLEISSEIFLQSIPPFPKHGAHRVPMLLLNVCNAWTEIALSTPAIWAAIHVAFPRARGLKNILPIWFDRARNHPLSVSLQVAEGFGEDVVPILSRHGQQLRHLELRDEDISEDAGSQSFSDDGISLCYILKLLRLAPNLEYLLVDTDIVPDVEHENFSHSELRRLTFGEPDGCPRGGLDIIMSLPKLETLSMELTSGALLPFLKESSPPLLELIIGEAGDLGYNELAQCLRFVPNLRRLEMWFPRYCVVENFMAALAGSLSLLPHLRTLRFSLDELDDEDAEITPLFWTTLARALAARRIQLQTFGFTGFRRSLASEMPTPDTIATLRGLAANGMQVCIWDSFKTWNILD
ncbi:hypothetical protein C8R45DRAFT_964505 [Mycena sanguinolenta]|nr:hypothetical protein C8R45DRAFT_964505 [Mycena sanguinolenta]